jgi:heat shock protein HtpX
MSAMKVFFLMVALMVLFLTAGFLIGGERGMILAFVIAAALNFFAYWASDKLILSMYKAREVRPEDGGSLKKLLEKVEYLARAANLEPPRVYVIPTKAPNAFATGRNSQHSAVAVTEGLLEILSGDELEGVIGHELAHIKNYDMLLGTVAATIVGAIGIIASIARFGAFFVGFSKDDRDGGIVGLIAVAILSPIIALILRSAISRQREFKADESGADLAGGRHLQLAEALRKIHRSPVRLNLDARPGTANLMIANPLSGKGVTGLFSTHPPVEKRIARLEAAVGKPSA